MAAKSSDAQVPEDDDLESSEENGKIYEITDALSCSGSQQSITHSNEVNASLNDTDCVNLMRILGKIYSRYPCVKAQWPFNDRVIVQLAKSTMFSCNTQVRTDANMQIYNSELVESIKTFAEIMATIPTYGKQLCERLVWCGAVQLSQSSGELNDPEGCIHFVMAIILQVNLPGQGTNTFDDVLPATPKSTTLRGTSGKTRHYKLLIYDSMPSMPDSIRTEQFDYFIDIVAKFLKNHLHRTNEKINADDAVHLSTGIVYRDWQTRHHQLLRTVVNSCGIYASWATATCMCNIISLTSMCANMGRDKYGRIPFNVESRIYQFASNQVNKEPPLCLFDTLRIIAQLGDISRSYNILSDTVNKIVNGKVPQTVGSFHGTITDVSDLISELASIISKNNTKGIEEILYIHPVFESLSEADKCMIQYRVRLKESFETISDSMLQYDCCKNIRIRLSFQYAILDEIIDHLQMYEGCTPKDARAEKIEELYLEQPIGLLAILSSLYNNGDVSLEHIVYDCTKIWFDGTIRLWDTKSDGSKQPPDAEKTLIIRRIMYAYTEMYELYQGLQTLAAEEDARQRQKATAEPSGELADDDVSNESTGEHIDQEISMHAC